MASTTEIFATAPAGGAAGVDTATVGGAGDRVDRIRLRAHELWLLAGCPGGPTLEFWLAAERDVDESSAGTESPA